MNTPICDFVKAYAKENALRLHMPGHKGISFLGCEFLDITEIDGADSLYEATGIIAESEANASRLFGCPTFYSTEGSSQCIRAMLYLAVLDAKKKGKAPKIAAGRNAHKTFLSAVALLDLDVIWIYPEQEEYYLSCVISSVYLKESLEREPSYLCCDMSLAYLKESLGREPSYLCCDMSSAYLKESLKRESSYLCCDISPVYLEEFLQREQPTAVYITSPDYLGHVADVAALSEVCHRYGVLLLVDNAHGAYLKFLQKSIHPIDLGADICCDSAHKTLPVLTGGAYLHVADEMLAKQTKQALALFGSTSPSYLILQSLDAANGYLVDYSEKLQDFCGYVEQMKETLQKHGFSLQEQEPLKLTIATKEWGYTGEEFATLLLAQNIVYEFADPDYVVLMFTPEVGVEGLNKLEEVLLAIPQQIPLKKQPPRFHKAERVMSVRQAVLSAAETLPVEQCEGRILAAATVGCPPAVPILVCGERIDKDALECFRYYGIESCAVVQE